jgi:hypothetical protein
MKKIFFFAFIFLAACSGQIPQVTVTSEVTLPPTETLIPTPTLHPQFVALQDQIAAPGERFTLLSDGAVQDGEKPVPGLQVDPKGVVTITVNGEQVEIDPSIMNFDDEKGLSIQGFQDTDANGDWEPAQEIITTPRGIGFVIGEPVEGQENTFLINEIINGDDTISLDNDVDLGYGEDDNQWVGIRQPDGTYRFVLQNIADPAIEVAEMGQSTAIWDFSKFDRIDQDNILFGGAKVLEKEDILSSVSAQTRNLNLVAEDIPGEHNNARSILYSKDGKRAILVDFMQRGDNLSTGYVDLIGDDGKPIVIFVKNFDLSLPPVTK